MTIRANGTINFIGAGKYISGSFLSARRTFSPVYSSTSSGDVSTVYVDAAEVSASGSGMYGLGGSRGFGLGSISTSGYPATGAKFYNLRVYSRALTAAEVAANYAVDKIRFNLA